MSQIQWHKGIGSPTALERGQNRSMPIPIPSFTHYQEVSRAKESRSWLPKFVQASVRPWDVWAIRGSDGRKSRKEGLGALRIFLRSGSQINIVHAFFGLRCGLAEEHFIVYNFRLRKTRRRIVPPYCRLERSIQAPSERRGLGEQVLGVFLIMKSWFERPQSFWSRHVT